MKFTETYRTAAREAVTRAPESRKPRLLDELFPENVMPTRDQFNAVYTITGKTERDRLGRIAQGRTPSAATESAWCRYHLRRWAMLQLVKPDGDYTVTITPDAEAIIDAYVRDDTK